jgi:PAS domain S-box-containing protein
MLRNVPNSTIKQFLIILLLLLFITSQANDLNFNFQPVKLKESQLSSKRVMALLQDSKGFIWIGTEAGVNVFDGYTYKVYKHDAKDSSSLSGDYVKNIVEDKNNNLLILSNSGVDIFNPEFGKFYRLSAQQGVNELLANSIRFIFQLKDKTIFFLSSKGLYLFNEDSKTAEKLNGINFQNLQDFGEYLPNTEDYNGVFWFAFGKLLYGYDRKNKKSISLNFDEFPEFEGEKINAIYNYDNQRLGIFSDETIYLLNPETKVLENSYVNNLPEGIPGFRTLMTMYQDSSNIVWFGTEESKIVTFNPKSSSFNTYLILDENGNSHGQLRNLIKDRQGLWWLGTRQNGLYYSYPNNQNSFTQFTPQSDNPNSLSGNTVSAIIKDNNGLLWIGTDGGGLNLYDPSTGKFKHYFHDPKNKNSLSTNAVLIIFQDSKGKIFIGGYNGGICIYNEQQDNFKCYLPDINKPGSISFHDVRGIVEGNDGLYYLSINGGNGLEIFDPNTETFRSTVYDPSTPGKSIISKQTTTVYKDLDGNIWVGTYEGLSKYDPIAETFTNYIPVAGDTTTLSHRWVYSILRDSDGILWIGTAYGLDRLNEADNSFTTFTEREGLPDNIVNCIIEDNEHNLWISTNKGISRLNKEKMEFRNFDASDGLKVEQFIRESYFKDYEGKIYFGGTGGLVILDPKNFTKNSYEPPVYLTNFQLFYQDVKIGIKGSPLEQTIAYTNKIVLTHRQNIITFSYVALNYMSPQKNSYACMMEGFDEDWIFVGSRREASYTNLSPGRYTFRVKAANNDGVWNDTGTIITVIVTPPWWKTWWFRLILFSSIIWLVYSFIKMKVQANNRDKKLLQSKIEAGQAEVKKQKDEIEAHLKTLQDKEIAERENKWYNEGMTYLSDIISKNNDDLYRMAQKLTLAIVEYVDAGIGAFFILNDEDPNNISFQLAGHYGIDEDLVKKVSSANEGYLGACYHEKRKLIIDNLPGGYVTLESGLGKVSLKVLTLIPLIQDTNLNGIIELASLEKLPDYKIVLLEKLAENLASSIEIIKVNERMKVLVEQMNAHAEELNAQKEEMQQNLEEVTATQEEMERIKLNDKEKDEKLLAQVSTLEKEKTEFHTNSIILKTLLNNINSQIFILDRKHALLMANRSFAEGNRIKSIDKLINKEIYELNLVTHNSEELKEELKSIDEGNSISNKVKVKKTSDKKSKWMSETFIPIMDEKQRQLGIISISTDISELKMLEKKYDELMKKLKTQS